MRAGTVNVNQVLLRYRDGRYGTGAKPAVNGRLTPALDVLP